MSNNKPNEMKNLQNKPPYLINTIEELKIERDRMELNWDDSMRSRMQTIAQISITKFKTPLSSL